MDLKTAKSEDTSDNPKSKVTKKKSKKIENDEPLHKKIKVEETVVKKVSEKIETDENSKNDRLTKQII
jgi:hypothetical protein